MSKELFTLSDKVKALREQFGITQADLGRRLGVTRSSVNGWETGIAIPSTALIAELAKLFHVTTDYLLGIESSKSLNAEGLNEKEVALIAGLIECVRGKQKGL